MAGTILNESMSEKRRKQETGEDIAVVDPPGQNRVLSPLFKRESSQDNPESVKIVEQLAFGPICGAMWRRKSIAAGRKPQSQAEVEPHPVVLPSFPLMSLRSPFPLHALLNTSVHSIADGILLDDHRRKLTLATLSVSYFSAWSELQPTR